MAKGSGMIHVNMATMLAFITTDAAVAPADLASVLRRCADGTFNMVTVDGDTSTNDMVLALANGASETGQLISGDGLEEFEAAFEAVCEGLTRAIASDGEGATRMFTVKVHAAADEEQARRMARTVASSNLVKAAVHGADPNWGRIVAALGRAGADLVLDRLQVTIGGHIVFRNGAGVSDLELGRVRDALTEKEVEILCDIGLGEGHARAFGCDLTPEYVHINADYTT
jgi:glutamate N-acetyltransferase/amino-acid N-acetyltransferase